MDGSEQETGVHLASLLSFGGTLLVAYFTARYTIWAEAKRDRRAEFRVRLQDILSLAIEYPYFENQEFCDGWRGRDPSDERYWRYEVYCCTVFNLIEDIWKHTKGKADEIEEIVHYEEWFVLHREWWTENQGPNVNGYAVKFYNFVESVVQAHNASKREDQ